METNEQKSRLNDENIQKDEYKNDVNKSISESQNEIIKRLLLLSDEKLGQRVREMTVNSNISDEKKSSHSNTVSNETIRELLKLSNEKIGQKIKNLHKTEVPNIDDINIKNEIDFYIKSGLSKSKIVALLKQQKKNKEEIVNFIENYDKTIQLIEKITEKIENKFGHLSLNELINESSELCNLYNLSQVEKDAVIRKILQNKTDGILLSDTSITENEIMPILTKPMSFFGSNLLPSTHTNMFNSNVFNSLFEVPKFLNEDDELFDTNNKNFGYSKKYVSKTSIDKNGTKISESISKTKKNVNGKLLVSEKKVTENKDNIIIEEIRPDGQKITTTRQKNNLKQLK